MKGVTLEEMDTATYQRINITHNVAWRNQMPRIASKALRGTLSLHFDERNISTNSRTIKERAYLKKTLGKLVMEYASTVCEPHQKLMISNIMKFQ